MITRDISLDDCILDLIDNSVDGAWHQEGGRPKGLAEEADLTAYRIEITATPEEFSIADNCGGMSLDDAVSHAFSFGRSIHDEHDDFSIGVYGIGMKRAVFKLGTSIRVRSTFRQEDGSTLSFAVPIQVEKWLEDDPAPSWDFDIVDDEPLEANGVCTRVDNLTPGALESFDNPSFLQTLRRTISRDYALHLQRGLCIALNGKEIAPWRFELLTSDDFAPVRIDYPDDLSGDHVEVELIAGMAAPPPESLDASEEDDGDRRMGWYVVCNGRIVLAADKTTISGWGTDNWPQWHSQYSGFIGIIFFTAAKAAALPLTTTKRSVDVSSEVWRRARPRMREATRSWIAYTNQRKQALDEARERERRAIPVSIERLPSRAVAQLPALVAKPIEKVGNIAYSMPVTRIRRLAQALGSINMSYRDVGINSFEYAYDDVVGEE